MEMAIRGLIGDRFLKRFFARRPRWRSASPAGEAEGAPEDEDEGEDT
jgi:hypothetical protein